MPRYLVLLFILIFGDISRCLASCQASIYGLETIDYGNVLSATLQFRNNNADKITIYSSVDGINFNLVRSTYTKTATINNLPKRVMFFKITIETAVGCIHESEVVSSIYLTASNSEYGQVNLKWNKVKENSLYNIYRDTLPIHTTGDFSYIDTNLDCNRSYLYQVETIYKNQSQDSVKVSSHFVTSFGNFSYNAPAKYAIGASVLGNNEVQINLLNPTGKLTYNLYRSDGMLVASQASPNFKDTINVVAQKPCYYLTFTDVCGFVSKKSPQFCPIILERKDSELLWNLPITLANTPVAYEILRLTDPQDKFLGDGSLSFDLLGIGKQAKEKYQISATIKFTINGEVKEVTVLSNVLDVDFTTNVFLPTAFSPNGDKQNDTFNALVDASVIDTFTMQIFDKWGKVIFETDNLEEGWTGELNGEKLPAGTYACKITYRNIFNVLTEKIGAIILLR